MRFTPLSWLTRKSIALKWTAFGLALVGVTAVDGAPYTLANSDVITMPTSVNGRTYTLNISLPSSYATSPTARYPVVYFLDAYWDFPLFAMDAGNLQVDGLIPDVILVGIGYAGANPDVGALRQLDYTPGSDPSVDPSGTTSGHAQEFLGIIANQFIPYIERNYRVDTSFRVLAGSSYGGLFTLYAALENPTQFQGYIAASPAAWWRNGYIQSREGTFSQSHSSFPARLYISVGGDDAISIINASRSLYQQLLTRTYANFAVAYWQIDAERHSSQKPEAYNRGLRFVFATRAPRPSGMADPAYNKASALINVSTRGAVGTGDGVLIGGFIVQGVNPKRVLVRAVGPGLTDYGVSNVLADPILTVHDASGAAIAQNDNWGDNPNASDLSLANLQAGCFALRSGSKDAATVLKLAPGAYTVVVSGANSTTGNALVEAYELPPQ